MSKINYIIEGENKNHEISLAGKDSFLMIFKASKNDIISKRHVSSYTVIDESNKDQYSFWKGALGVALFGGLGAIAGVKGKQKKEYLVAIEFKNGAKSLALLDEDHYKDLVRVMF